MIDTIQRNLNQPFDRAIDTCKNSQCGNFMILAVTQILREINFEDSWSAKSAVLTNLQAVNFYFLQIWALFKGWNLSNERPYNGKTAVFALIDPRNWFHVKSEHKKILKFPHWRIGMSLLICANISGILIPESHPSLLFPRVLTQVMNGLWSVLTSQIN